MRRELWFLLLTIILVSDGLSALPVLAANDDGFIRVPGYIEESYSGQPRYLVTFIKSRTTDPIRTATVVSVTNQTNYTCHVSINWFRGFDPNPVCTTTFDLDAGFQTDFCSRQIPDPITSCNATCAPELTFHEGKAVVSADCRDIGVSARVYYTRGDDDGEVSAISDAKIVRFGQGNRGD
jgi:hypothetical protein